MTGRFQRPDRRDAFLILIGLLSLLLGYAYGVTTVPAGVHTSLDTITQYVPLTWFAAMWMVTGAVCIASAFTAQAATGFAVAVFMPTTWGIAYLIGWLGGDTGRGWVTTAIFWALAGAVFCVAGLIDPTPVTRRGAGR